MFDIHFISSISYCFSCANSIIQVFNDDENDKNQLIDRRTCCAAARGGQLHVLKWARANGCVWDARVCACAALSGNFEVLKWARANGCDWDEQTCARGGHLEVLACTCACACVYLSVCMYVCMIVISP